MIGGSFFSIYRSQRSALQTNLKPHEAVGEMMAHETATLLGSNAPKRIVVLALDIHDPGMKAQMRSFDRTIARSKNIRVFDKIMLKPDQKHRPVPGGGLSARRFVDVLIKYRDVDAIVSFAGLPNPEKEEINALAKIPIVVAETTQPGKLTRLFDKGMVQVAIVPRYIFPAPVQEPKTAREWFDKYFQIVRVEAGVPVVER
jgi:hypothetical protein